MNTNTATLISTNQQSAWSEPRSKRNYWAKWQPEDFVNFPILPELSYHAETQLIRKAQAGNLAARNEVWLRKVRLVLSVINKFQVPEDLLSDALQEGAIGIHRAIDKFEIERYLAFTTYAWKCVFNHIHRFLHSYARQAPIPAYLYKDYRDFRQEILRADSEWKLALIIENWKRKDVVLADKLVSLHRLSTAVNVSNVATIDLPVVQVQNRLESFERTRLALRYTSELPKREQHIIIRRYGLDGEPPETLKEIGDKMGLTRERIRQLEAQTLEKLHRKLS